MVEAVIGEGGFKPVPRRCWSHRTLGGQRVGQGVPVSGGGAAHGVTQGESHSRLEGLGCQALAARYPGRGVVQLLAHAAPGRGGGAC